MGELYQLPEIVPSDEHVDLFLERCQAERVSSIDIMLRGIKTPLDMGDTLLRISLSVKYQGQRADQRTVLVRPFEHLASAYYRPSDTALEDPLGIFPRPRPWEKLGEYGLTCAEYCASKKFDVNVFLKGSCSGSCSPRRGSLLHQVRPADVVDKEGIYLPLLLIA